MLLRAVIGGFGLVALGSGLLGCTDDPSPPAVAKQTADYVEIDAIALCHLYTTDCPQKTGQTLDECVAIYKAVRVPPACKDKLHGLTCETATTGVDECWPSCDGSQAAQCDGPHIIECAPTRRTFTYDCNGVCETQKKTWSGSCGTSYKTEKSSVATCWCN